MDAQNFHKIIHAFLEKATVNGVLPYSQLTRLVQQYGNSLNELPLSVLNNKQFEVKPGVVIHFQSHATDNSVMLKDISFDSKTGVEFSYQNIHYAITNFTLGTNQVVFDANGVEILDQDNHPIQVTGAEAFSAPAA